MEDINNPRKRKDIPASSQSGTNKDDKAISWLRKQTIPKGSSPLYPFNSPNYYSSSDEEYEGFLDKGFLILSAPKSTSKEAMTDYLRPFTVKLRLDKQKTTNQRKKVPVSFDSHEYAKAALKRYKERKLNKQSIALKLSVNERYQSFCITDFKKTLTANEIPKYVANSFKRFGDILHVFTPEGVEDTAYFYISLKEGFTAEKVEKELAKEAKSAIGRTKPKFRLCYIKPSVTKAEFAKVATH